MSDRFERRLPPIYCTGGCDACRDYARELGVPLIVPTQPARADTATLVEAARAVSEAWTDMDEDEVSTASDAMYAAVDALRATLAQPAPALDVEGWLDEMRYDGTARDPWQRGWNAALSAAKHAIKENR